MGTLPAQPPKVSHRGGCWWEWPQEPLREGHLGAVNLHFALQSSGKQMLWIKTNKAKRGWWLQNKCLTRVRQVSGLGFNLCNAEIMVVSALSAWHVTFPFYSPDSVSCQAQRAKTVTAMDNNKKKARLTIKLCSTKAWLVNYQNTQAKEKSIIVFSQLIYELL